MKSRPATPLTTAARTFLTALSRCRVSSTPMPSTAISSTPCAAPKYPPYTPVSSTAGHTHHAPWCGHPAGGLVPCGDPRRDARLEDDQDQAQQDQRRHDGGERALGQHQQQQGAGEPADQRRDAQPQHPAPLAVQLAAVADGPRHRAGHQPDGVGDVGRHRRNAERQQGRERDQRSRPHHGVDGAGGETCEQDRRGFEGGHGVAGASGSAGRCSGRPPGRSPSRRPLPGLAALSASAIAASTASFVFRARCRRPPWPAPWPARGLPMSTRVFGTLDLLRDALEVVHRRAEALERLADLARHDPDLVGVALGDLRHHLQVLVGQQRLVGVAVVDRLEDGLDGLALTLGAQDRATPGRPGPAGSATRAHPRRSGSRTAWSPRPSGSPPGAGPRRSG